MAANRTDARFATATSRNRRCNRPRPTRPVFRHTVRGKRPDRRSGSLPLLRDLNADQVEPLIARIAAALVRPVPTTAEGIVLRLPEALDGEPYEADAYSLPVQGRSAHLSRQELF